MRKFATGFTISLMLLAYPAFAEYAQVRGIKMYYEIRGAGPPVVLLHGGTATLAISFAKQIPVLAANRRVIGIEQMGHGHTPDVNGRELSYEGMTEDTAALLMQLGVRNADVIGWSDGGQIALRLAAVHPELVRRLVASGVGLGPSGPAAVKTLSALTAAGWDKTFVDEYVRVSPDGAAHWPVFFEKNRAMWMRPSWGFTESDLARITAPALIIAGDHDYTSAEETARIAHLIPGGKLLILPGTDHFTFQKRAEWLNPILLDFLK